MYPEVLRAIADPDHPEHEELFEWLAPDFDSESFDVDETNEVLVSTYGTRSSDWPAVSDTTIHPAATG